MADPQTGKYNSAVITKLVRNFRSHRDILKIPSELFYNSDLVPVADPAKTEQFITWKELPKPGFPIIFEGVVGVDQRDGQSPSYYNKDEAAIVVRYLETILSLDQPGIGQVLNLNQFLSFLSTFWPTQLKSVSCI